MGSRSRSRVIRVVSNGGTRQFIKPNGSILATYSGATGDAVYESCADVTMAPPYTVDHGLAVKRYGFEQELRLNGDTPSYVYGTTLQRYNNYCPGRVLYSYTSSSESPINWDYYKTKALAGLDPYKPEVDLPLFLFELKDFPRMLKNAGDVLSGRIRAKTVPESWLAYSFGWAPLVNDVLALFDFTKATDARCRYLRNLESGKVIRRTLAKETLRDEIAGLYEVSMAGTTKRAVKAYRRVTEERRVWMTANGTLKTQLPNSSSALRGLSKRIVLGLTWRPASFWEYIPWSWLVDYCWNVGDYLQAHGTNARLSVTRMNLMATTTIFDRLVDVELAPGITITGGTGVYTSKRRSPYVNPTPTLTSRPFLGAVQKANLGALVTAAAFGNARGIRTAR